MAASDYDIGTPPPGDVPTGNLRPDGTYDSDWMFGYYRGPAQRNPAASRWGTIAPPVPKQTYTPPQTYGPSAEDLAAQEAAKQAAKQAEEQAALLAAQQQQQQQQQQQTQQQSQTQTQTNTTPANSGEVFKNYNVNTGQGNVDQAYLQSPEGQAYLRDHPGEAYMYYIANRYGGLNKVSDSQRAWLRGQQDQATANFRLRSHLMGFPGQGANDPNFNLLNILQGGEGLASITNPAQSGDIIRRLVQAADSGDPRAQELQDYMASSQGTNDLWNQSLYASNPSSPITAWLSRLSSADRPYNNILGGTMLDYWRQRYGQ